MSPLCRDLTSLALIVSDSLDGSRAAVRNRVTGLRGTYRRATILGRDFGYNQVPQQPAIGPPCSTGSPSARQTAAPVPVLQRQPIL